MYNDKTRGNESEKKRERKNKKKAGRTRQALPCAERDFRRNYRVHEKRSEDGINFRENVRSRAWSARSASVRRADPLVLARVPGMGRLAACFPCSVFLDRPDFSLSPFDLPSLRFVRSFFLSLPPSLSHSVSPFLYRYLARAHAAPRLSLSLSIRLSFSPSLPPLSTVPSFSGAAAYPRALTCEVSKTGVPSYVLRHCAIRDGEGMGKGEEGQSK